MRTLAHLSDLHLGLSNKCARAAERLVAALIDAQVDHVLVTGDLTHRGLDAELELFQRLFAPLRGRLTIVPGNHDRLGDEVARRMMQGQRVLTASAAGLYIVRVDSTGPHNRSLFRGHGQLLPSDLDAIDAALDHAPPGALCVAALHHHMLPLPEEDLSEHISRYFGWPFAAELSLGRALLDRLSGRCDLVLHGHRHVPAAQLIHHPARPLRIHNAGSSTALGKARLYAHHDGALIREPNWIGAPAEIIAPRARPRQASTLWQGRTGTA